MTNNDLFKERLNSKTTVEIFGKQPIIYVDINALGKMKEYVDGCSDEIGWLGEVTRENDVYVIEEVHLFKQEVHATTCEITTEGLTDFANELLMLPDGVERWNNIKAWFHSHVNMGVSPSAQDESQMSVFKDCGHDFFIRAIANKKGEMEFTLYDYEKGLKYKDVKWKTLYRNEEMITLQSQLEAIQRRMKELAMPSIDKDVIKAEIKQKVSKKSYGIKTGTYGNVYGNTYGGTYGTAYGQNWDEWYQRQGTTTAKKNETKVVTLSNTKSTQSVVDKIIEEYAMGEFKTLEDEFTSIQIQSMAYASDTDYVKRMVKNIVGEAINEKQATIIAEHCLDYSELISYL